MATAERDGWTDIVDEYRALTARATAGDRLRAARGFGRRAHRLERRARALLEIE